MTASGDLIATAGPSGTTSRSAFWRMVGDLGPQGTAATGSRLGAATRAAWRRGDAAVGFRRNRELVDVRDRFRWFTVDGAPHVAKILTSQAAAAERRQASRTDERLRRYDTPFTVPVPELVPIDGERAALVLPDLGRTLAEDSRLLPPFDTVTGLLDSLLAAGVSWRGFAPRNLCPAQGPGEYTLIDLEHASFLDGDGGPRGIHVLTVLFWALDWCPVGEDPLDVEARLLDVLGRHGLTTVTGEADAYERCFAEVTGHALDRARQLVREATIRSWRPLGPGQQGGRCFSPSELCQLCDELLPLEHAVLTTQTLARLREDLGEDGYADLLGRLEATLCAVLAEAGAASSTRLDLARVCAELDTSVGALLARSGQRTAPDGDNWFLLARSCAAT